MYYASAARSMSRSWHAFAFGAFDPAATITLDKLSGFLIPQALSIKIFGFHEWALALPQAIEGVVTVFCAYTFGSRWRGHVFGLTVAGVVTITPLLAAMFGKPMEDGLLTMAMALALVCWQRSLAGGHPLWLAGAAVWVAVGFQAKMLQAWLILPAIAVAYLLAADGSFRSRLARILGFCSLALILSIAWMTAMQLVPAGDRPYFDGSTNNNVFSMVFGYNGVDRILPGIVPGAVPQLEAVDPGTATAVAASSPLKLLLPQYTSQIGWLFPAAIVGTVLGLARYARDRSGRFHGATVLVLVSYCALVAVVLSLGVVAHATYFGVLGVPIAALAVAGASDAVARFRFGTVRSRVPLLVLIFVQTAWAAYVFATAALAFRWGAVVAAVLGTIALVLLVTSGGRRKTFRLGVAAAVTAALLGPVIWSACVIGAGGGGSASDAYAGPRPPGLNGLSAKDQRNAGVIRVRAPFASRPDQMLTKPQADLESSLAPTVGQRGSLFATDDRSVAQSFALFSDFEVPLMGGFSGHAPTIRPTVRYFLLADLSPAPASATLTTQRSWVKQNCRVALTGTFEFKASSRQTLYDCGP